jgi:hypothetical protein
MSLILEGRLDPKRVRRLFGQIWEKGANPEKAASGLCKHLHTLVTEDQGLLTCLLPDSHPIVPAPQ